MAFFGRSKANDQYSGTVPPGYSQALREEVIPHERTQLLSAQRRVSDLVLQVRQHAQQFRQVIGTLEGAESIHAADRLDGALSQVLSRCAQQIETPQLQDIVQALETMARKIHAECEAVIRLGNDLESVDIALLESGRYLKNFEAEITRLYHRINSPKPATASKNHDNAALLRMLDEVRSKEGIVREHAKQGFAGIHVSSDAKNCTHVPVAKAADELCNVAQEPMQTDAQVLAPQFSALKLRLMSQHEQHEDRLHRADLQQHQTRLRSMAMHARRELEVAVAPRMQKFSEAFDYASAILSQRVLEGHRVSSRDHKQLTVERYRDFQMSHLSHLTAELEQFLAALPVDYHDQMDVLDMLLADLDSVIYREKQTISKLFATTKRRVHSGELAANGTPQIISSAHRLHVRSRSAFIAFQSATEQHAIVSSARLSTQITAPIQSILRYFKKRGQRSAEAIPISAASSRESFNGKKLNTHSKRRK